MVLERFDITSLLSFRPATRFCQKCFGLNVTKPTLGEPPKFVCSICEMEYVARPGHVLQQGLDYFKSRGLMIGFRDVMTHSQSLATIANRMRQYSTPSQRHLALSPMQGLLEALNAAQQFVHFVTYGMSPELLGVMRMLSFRVPVRGIISNANPHIAEEMTKYLSESPRLDVKIYRQNSRAENSSTPHQKLIVIDGLLAFKGSANLTLDGWRKAAKGFDAIEVVTDMKEVVDLNNRYFSPVWASFSDMTQIVMYNSDADDIPF